MEKLKMYSLVEAEELTFGKLGTQKREAYEAEKRTALEADRERLAAIVREARERERLTQAQLAELAAVNRTQISRIENGRNTFWGTISRVLRALNLQPLTYEDTFAVQ